VFQVRGDNIRRLAGFHQAGIREFLRRDLR